MSPQATHIDAETYLQGIPLSKAPLAFANAQTIQAYDATLEEVHPSIPPEKGILGALSSLSANLNEIQKRQYFRQNIENNLKKQILTFIRKGDLISYGFKMPRNIEDYAIKIPADLFFGGEINWDKSTLNSQDLEFSGIHLFKNTGAIVDIDPSLVESSKKQAKNKSNEQFKKKNFLDLGSNLHINEKEAAKLLGISHRTLQGYRSKGGGPKFLKLKKSVRYRIQDLITWADENKKENTVRS